jgi:hypothetical protein
MATATTARDPRHHTQDAIGGRRTPDIFFVGS